MKFSLFLTVSAIALSTTAIAAPAQRLPMQAPQNPLETKEASTERARSGVAQHVVKAEWLHLISSDDDESDEDDCDDDDDDCADHIRGGSAAAPNGQSTPPQNGLFTPGKAPSLKSN